VRCLRLLDRRGKVQWCADAAQYSSAQSAVHSTVQRSPGVSNL
jgi:hypothetical protein